MMRVGVVTALIALSACFGGCGSSGTPVIEKVQAPAPDPIARAKAILTNYANGMPVTSEAESFSEIAANVKAKDPGKGEMLEKGLAEIRAKPSIAQSKAKELLGKL